MAEQDARPNTTPLLRRIDEPVFDDEPRMVRTSADMICALCGREYRKHPMATSHLDWRGEPFLRKLCDGRLAKL